MDRRPELPRLTPKPVNFVPIEPIDLSDEQLALGIKNSIKVYKAYDAVDYDPVFLSEAYFADMNNDGEREIIAAAKKGQEIELYVMKHNSDYSRDATRFFGRFSPRSGIEGLRVLDATGDGKPEIIFTSVLENGYPYTIITSDKFSHPKGLAGVREIRDLDGDGLPEFCTGSDFPEWNGEDFVSDRYVEYSLAIVKDAIADAATTGNESTRLSVVRQLESMYPDEIISSCMKTLLDEPQFSRATNAQSMLKLTLPEFVGLLIVQNAAREYGMMQAEKRERELVQYYGGNPRTDALLRDADGNVVGRRVNQNYRQPPTADQYTVGREAHSYPFGSYERRTVALTPQDAADIRRARVQEGINNDPVVRAYQRFEGAAGQAQQRVDGLLKILAPSDAKKK